MEILPLCEKARYVLEYTGKKLCYAKSLKSVTITSFLWLIVVKN